MQVRVFIGTERATMSEDDMRQMLRARKLVTINEGSEYDIDSWKICDPYTTHTVGRAYAI